MKGKLLMLLAILATVMLVAISAASATQESKKQISPLYKIRTKNAINEKIENIKENLLQNRVFLVFSFFDFKSNTDQLHTGPLAPSCPSRCTKCIN